MKRVLLALVLCLGSGRALALDQPAGSDRDGRIKVVDYNERDVVAVDVSLSNATQISFGPTEEVLDIASGFSLGWEIVNRRNHIYLKAKSIKGPDGLVVYPCAGKWDTNLMVTTTAHSYAFQLIAHVDRVDKRLGYDPTVAFRVQFRYPAEEVKKAQKAEAAQAAKKALDRRAPPRNWNYSMQVGPASESVAPTAAYDDGRFTYLRFPVHREMPSVYLVDAAGNESLVNTHIDPSEPDVVVIQRVAPQFVLRLGDEVVAVFNEGFDPNGRTIRQSSLQLSDGTKGTYNEISEPSPAASAPETGSAIPGVRRTVRTDSDGAPGADARPAPPRRPGYAPGDEQAAQVIEENLLLYQRKAQGAQ